MDFKIKCVFIFSIFFSTFAYSQKPTIMVIPSNSICKERGYLVSKYVNGQKREFVDYVGFFNDPKNKDVKSMITKIMDIYSSPSVRFPLTNLEEQLKSLQTDNFTGKVRNEDMTGYEKVIKTAKPDIILDLQFAVVQRPGTIDKSVEFTLTATDSYTLLAVAAKDGRSAYAKPYVSNIDLFAEVVEKYVSELNASLMSHFNDIIENGMSVKVKFVLDKNSSKQLTDNIDVNGKSYPLKKILKGVLTKLDHEKSQSVICTGDESYYTCTPVRIPKFYIDDLFNEKTKMTAEDFGQQVVEMLSGRFKVDATSISYGLGVVRIIIK